MAAVPGGATRPALVTSTVASRPVVDAEAPGLRAAVRTEPDLPAVGQLRDREVRDGDVLSTALTGSARSLRELLGVVATLRAADGGVTAGEEHPLQLLDRALALAAVARARRCQRHL